MPYSFYFKPCVSLLVFIFWQIWFMFWLRFNHCCLNKHCFLLSFGLWCISDLFWKTMSYLISFQWNRVEKINWLWTRMQTLYNICWKAVTWRVHSLQGKHVFLSCCRMWGTNKASKITPTIWQIPIIPFLSPMYIIYIIICERYNFKGVKVTSTGHCCWFCVNLLSPDYIWHL